MSERIRVNVPSERGLEKRRLGAACELFAALSYVVVVLGVDVARFRGWLPAGMRETLRQLHLVTDPSGFDWYKFVMWLVVPLIVSLPTARRAGYSFYAARREWSWLGGVFVVSCVAMAVVATNSDLSAVYLQQASRDWSQRWNHAQRQLIWTLSWLPGYEFMMRWVLLPRANVLGVWSLVVVAMVEFVYHLQKPLMEACAVLLFSLALSAWARRHTAPVLPFLAHLCVELVLIGFIASYGV